MTRNHTIAWTLAATAWLGGLGAFGAVPAEDLKKIRDAAPAEAPVKVDKPRKLLVFTLAKGFIHDSTPWCVEALRIVGEKTAAYTIVHSQDPAVFRAESLQQFDAVCFLNTCLTPFTDESLKRNLMDFVKNGKGYVGIHCSAHTFLDWAEFGQMQGAYSVSHPWHEKVTCRIEEPDHPLMRCFPGDSFQVTDEIYLFDKTYSRENLRVLMSLDVRRTDMTKKDITRKEDDFGLVWIRSFGKGRSFYTAFGHDVDLFWKATILRHYLLGIQFAFGDLKADTTPSAKLPSHKPPAPWAAPPRGPRRVLEGARLLDGVIFAAMKFDGSDSQAVALGDLKLRSPATVAMWIKTPEPGNDRRILSQGGGPAGRFGALRLEQGQLQVAAPDQWRALVPRGVRPDTWRHLAVVYGPDGRATGYLNAQPQQSAATPLDFDGVEAVIGGRYVGEWGLPFLGEMNDVRIYRKAMSGDEIARLCREAVPPGADLSANSVEECLADVARYRVGQSRSALTEAEERVRQSLGDPARQQEMEKRLVAILESPQATPEAKEFACRQLRLVGSSASVPALSKLLTDEGLSHAARMALQQNPDPACGQALRDALGAVKGAARIGVINSIGVRRDAQGVAALKAPAGDADRQVAAAAIDALGRIGSAEAADVLSAMWEQDRAGVADALLLCADRLAGEGQAARALAICRRVRDDAACPKAARVAAIIAMLRFDRQNAAANVGSLLGSDDPAIRGVAAGYVRQLPVEQVTSVLLPRLGQLPTASQVLLLQALADRPDPGVTAAMLKAASHEDASVRTAAVSSLGSMEGTAEVAGVLARAAAGRKGAEQAAARDSLSRLRGRSAEEALIAMIASGSREARVEVIQAVCRRGVAEAAGELLKAAGDAEPSVRLAAINALGTVGGAAHYAAMIGLLTGAKDSAERDEARRAVLSVAHRIEPPDARAAPLVAAMPQASAEAQAALLSALSALGGPQALQAVRHAAASGNATIQDAAVRALANWGDVRALQDLLQLAKTAPNETHRILALRGAIRLTALPGVRPAEQTAALYRQAMDLAARNEEKKLILSGLGNVAHAEALRLAESCAGDEALKAEAAQAIEKIKKAAPGARAIPSKGDPP